MPTDTRSAVAEAIEKLSADVPAEPEVEAPEPAGDAAPEPEPQAAAEPERSAGERARDQQGRFAKAEKERKEAAAAAVDQATPTEPAKPVVDPVLPELKPPQDWRAAAKEKFKTAPREVQEEAIRLYGETRKTLDRAAALEKEIEPWKQATAPYEHMLRVAGVPPAQAVGNLLRTYAALQSGPAPVKAQILADLIRNYGGSDEAFLTLVGKAIDAGGSAQPREQPQALSPDQIRELVRQERQAEDAKGKQEYAAQLLQDFQASGHEYFEQVQPELTAVASSWRARNPTATVTKEVLKQWYDRACELNDETAPIIKQRKDAAAAKAKNASTQSAAAASGVKNEPAGPTNGIGPAKDTREEVARQMKKARQARV